MLSKDLLKQLISTRQKKSYFDNPIEWHSSTANDHTEFFESSSEDDEMKSKQQELDVCEHMVISRKHTLLQANQSRNPNGWIFVLLSPIAYGDLI